MPQILTLSELQKQTSAYNSFARISDCSIPNYYKEAFPHKCACGAEMIMTEPGHTQLQCCNPSCWVKMGHRLSYFISSLGYKGFGEASGLSLVRATHDILPYKTFLATFLLNDTQLSSGLSEYYVGVFNDIKEDIKARPFHFVDAISALGIPNIGSRSSFFDVVKSPVILLDYLLHDKLNDLCDMSGIQAPITRFQLAMSKVDIVTLMKDVMPNIMDTPKGEVFVAITGKVSVRGVQYTRHEFIELCEAIKGPNGEQLFMLVETKAEAKLQYVIADFPSSSDKYKLGERLGKLITADEFYNELEAQAKTADGKE